MICKYCGNKYTGKSCPFCGTAIPLTKRSEELDSLMKETVKEIVKEDLKKDIKEDVQKTTQRESIMQNEIDRENKQDYRIGYERGYCDAKEKDRIVLRKEKDKWRKRLRLIIVLACFFIATAAVFGYGIGKRIGSEACVKRKKSQNGNTVIITVTASPTEKASAKSNSGETIATSCEMTIKPSPTPEVTIKPTPMAEATTKPTPTAVKKRYTTSPEEESQESSSVLSD